MNQEVKAKLMVENNGEYFQFNAIAENKSLGELNLTYEFSTFIKDYKGKVIKDSLGGRFFLKAQERKKINQITFNAGEQRRVIIILVIYDQNGKPLGQDRIVINDTDSESKTKLILDLTQKENTKEVTESSDMAKPQDGFFYEGLVVENSITKMGRDFYRMFYSKYYLSGLKSDKNIVIDELPFKARTTRVSVKIDDQIIWQFFANPSQDFLQKQADFAFNNVVAKLRQLNNTKESIIRY